MDSSNYFKIISPHVPEKIVQGLAASPVDELALDNLVRLLSGAECSSQSSPDVREEWRTRQQTITATLSSLVYPNGHKRQRNDETGEHDTAKRPRLSPTSKQTTASPNEVEPGRSIFALQSISATAPVRKKLDIVIHEHALVFLNTATKVMEIPPIPLTVLRRAFLLPTRGKTKPHWTVVILSSDSQPSTPGKSAKDTREDNPQVIFGVDANLGSALTTVTYDSEGAPTTNTHKKGSDTLPILRDFLSRLATVPLLEPDPSIFKSVVPGLVKNANPGGIPGIEAYRAAKPGTLWFMPQGILWGESRPCEFWAVEDLVGRTDGVRIIGGTGKTCSVILSRKRLLSVEDQEQDGEQDTQEQEDIGEETEFSMIDSREKEGIQTWVRKYQQLFGGPSDSIGKDEHNETKKSKEPLPAGPLTIHQLGDISDSSDEDFKADSSDESPSDNDSESSQSDEDGESGGEDEDSENEGENGDNSARNTDAESTDESEEELDPKHHPLLRAGRLPKMSKAVVEMAAAMVMDDFMGDEEGDEVDELME